jgi:hypothetical protein
MSAGTSIEQRLKSQMDRVQVRLRPDLAREAYRAHRRHRVRSRSAAAVATAIVIAGGATMAATGRVPFSAAPRVPGPSPAGGRSGGLLPPASMPPPAPGDDLTAQQAAHDIFWQHIIMRATPATDTFVTNQYQYGTTTRLTMYSPDGAPKRDNEFTGATITDGTLASTTTSVDYQSRTWVREVSQGADTGGRLSTPPALSGQRLCVEVQQMGLGAVDFMAYPDAARSLLACKALVAARGQRIDGIDAVTFSDAKIGETLWVNAVTYLPVQLTDVFPPGGRTIPTPGPATYANVGETIQYGFLPPTSANLPYLSAPLPAGFTGTTTTSTSSTQSRGPGTVPLAP